MFSRKRDALAKQVNVPTELVGFVDWNSLIQGQEKFVGRSMAVTLAIALGSRLIGGPARSDNAVTTAKVMGCENSSKSSLRPLLLLRLYQVILAAVYLVNQIPYALPQRLSSKIPAELDAIDYVHGNASRIANSVRKVLRIPGENLQTGLARSVEQLSSERDETVKHKSESDAALKYFSHLVREGRNRRTALKSIDPEAAPPLKLVSIKRKNIVMGERFIAGIGLVLTPLIYRYFLCSESRNR